MLTDLFKDRYMKALGDYRMFYDDANVYGDLESARFVAYGIPGINGSPGQFRFALPAFSRLFGNEFYMKVLHIEPFSTRYPIWQKYTIDHLNLKRDQIQKDIKFLLSKRDQVAVFISSNGLYDFLHAVDGFTEDEKARLVIFWVACAPDYFEPTRWETFFYKLNGFIYDDYRWAAFPNHNWLKFLNPETTSTLKWKPQRPYKRLSKHDVEFRFQLGGILWGYYSIDCFNDCLKHMLRHFSEKLSMKTYVLAASNDGYWQGKTQQQIEQAMRVYLADPVMMFKPTSHLWVVTADNITELLQRALLDQSIQLATADSQQESQSYKSASRFEAVI